MTDTNAEAHAAVAALEDPLFHRCPDPSCRRQFSRKYSLSEHMKTHTGERPHMCPVRSCAKRFTTSGNLARHKRLHGYIEPLKCPVEGCICSFPSDLKLEKHMKFHYGGPVHLCEVAGCGKTFTTTGNLNRHMKNHHLDDAPVGALRTPCCSMTRDAWSPTTADAWRPESLFTAPQCRVKRAWSTGTNPLPQESATNFSRKSDEHLAALDETLDNLSALLVETGLDSPACSGDRPSCLVDDIVRFHVQELGYP
ncbi:hypothetical protein PR003_g9142 [Phytophthora rubi]|uniref:C2H2-type domain-containing protein n=1 Tax=Phytophthora rubi TaxID=129364 RepID=A0A6A3MPV9_9STRA|nr:hypothetical protein PR002_g8883 [Phytophthora rubi]KAE9037034.1 hypothetical protein PR001_g8561 [Phytophthora rubi]KAE9343116.1 hypothetical protein PR003_g9142 [Phytophthora rubi]